ncbi:hypothetical protein [Hoylesella shahii]|nr:hypothetical protein [Hoylesella shahii]
MKEVLFLPHTYNLTNIYIEWIPAGKLLYVFFGTSLRKFFSPKGAAYMTSHSITASASLK